MFYEVIAFYQSRKSAKAHEVTRSIVLDQQLATVVIRYLAREDVTFVEVSVATRTDWLKWQRDNTKKE